MKYKRPDNPKIQFKAKMNLPWPNLSGVLWNKSFKKLEVNCWNFKILLILVPLINVMKFSTNWKLWMIRLAILNRYAKIDPNSSNNRDDIFWTQMKMAYHPRIKMRINLSLLLGSLRSSSLKSVNRSKWTL